MRVRLAIAAVALSLAPLAAEASPAGPGDFLRLAQADATPTPTPAPAPAAEGDDPFAHQRRIVPLPPLIYYDRRPDRKSEFFMLGMVWWSASNPDRDYQLLAPLFYRRKNKVTDATTLATPLFYYYRSPESRAIYGLLVYHEWGKNITRTGVPPLFWYGRVGGDVTSYLFPIYFYEERDGEMVLATPLGGGWGPKNDRQILIGPFYARRANTETLKLNAEVFFPFYWHTERPGEETRVLLTGFVRTRYAKRATKRVYGLAPFFYRRTSSGGSGTTITPLFVHERKDPTRDWLATPIGGYSRAPGYGLAVIGPWIYSRREQGERSETLYSLVPLFFHGHGHDGDDKYSWTVAGTYIRRVRESEGRRESFTALFPLFFRGSGESDRDSYSWTVVGPYFDRTRTAKFGDGSSHTTLDRALLPLFWYSRDGKDLRFVSPVAFFHRHENGDFRGVFGPFYRSWSDDHQTWVLLPIAWWHRSPRYDRNFGVLPFYFVRTKDHDTHLGLIPLFFYRNWVAPMDGKRRRSVTLLPVFHFSEKPGHLTFLSLPYVQVRRPGERQIMAGLLWWDRRAPEYRNLTFIPFFHWERMRDSRELITPVGGYRARPGYHRSLWGPVYHRTDVELGIRDQVVFPLYWNLNRPGRKFFLLGAYYNVREGQVHYEGLVPFWWRSEFPDYSQSIVFPFLLYRRDKVEKTRAWFTPVGGLWTQEDPKAWRLLAPLVYLARGPEKRSAVLFPLFFYDFDHGRQTIVAPLFYTRRDDESLTVTAIPAFFYRREPGSTLLLTPGVFYSRTEDRRTTIVLPVYWATQTKLRTRGLLGLYFWDESRTTEDDFFRMLFPVFAWTRKGSDYSVVTPVGFRSHMGRRTTTAFLPGLGWATRQSASGETVSFATLVGPLYMRTAPEARDFVIFQVLWHEKGHGRSTTALVPLFHHTRTAEGWRFLTFVGGGAKYERSSWIWLLNFVHARDNDRTRTAFVPLFFLEKDTHRFSLVTPLFFHAQDREARTAVTIAPLFYRRTSPERDTWVGFPLLWHDEDKVHDRTQGAFLPFALWGRQGERGYWAAPLLLSYRQTEGANHLRVHGPLVDVKVAGRRTVALIPIFRYYSNEEEDSASFASLPFLFWVRHGEHTRAFMGVGYWNSETGTRVWPLYGRWQARDADGNLKRSVEVLLPLYVRYKKPNRDIMVVGPYYRTKRTGPEEGTTRGFGPFYWENRAKTDYGTEFRWKILGFLVEYDRYDTQKGRERALTILVGFRTRLKTIPIPQKSAKPPRTTVAVTTREEGARAGAELAAY